MPWTAHPRVMAVRRRFAIVDVAVETLDGFRRHQTGRNAAVLAYWGFLSIFPLLLAATTILGFVLEGNEDLRDDILDSALSQIPVVGTTIEANAGALEGNTWALVIGLLTALWASMKAFLGVQAAFDDVWEVDIDARANTAIKRLRALIGLVAIGLSQIATVFLSGIAAGAEIRAISKLLLVAGALAINIDRAGNGVPLPDIGAGHVEDGVAGRGVRGRPVHGAAAVRNRGRVADDRQRQRGLRHVRVDARPDELVRPARSDQPVRGRARMPPSNAAASNAAT